MRKPSHHAAGFTLVELIIALGIGLAVLGASVLMFQKATEISAKVSLQGEMQQNARAAINSMMQDILLAGTGGMPLTGIALPSGTGATNTKVTCYPGTCDVTVTTGGVTSPLTYPDGFLHVINPMGKVGINNANGTSKTDVITVAYGDADPNFQLDCIPLKKDSNNNGVTPAPASGTPSSFTLTFDPNAFSTSGCPVTTPASPVLNPLLTSSDGLQTGDVLELTNANGIVAGVVTDLNESGSTHQATVGSGSNDALNFNQFSPPGGTIPFALGKNTGSYPVTSVFRLWLISYYLKTDPSSGSMRLMRQVNSRSPVPVAEYLDDLVITYDTYDQTTGVDKANLDASAVYNPGATPPVNNINNIRKVNLQVTVRSSRLYNGQYLHLRVVSSIDPRALGYQDRYQ